MDFPLSKAAELNLDAGRYKDRVGGTPGSLITGADFLNPVLDELINQQSLAGLAATEGENNQVGLAAQILARGGALGFRVKPQDPASLSVDIEAGAFFSRATGLMVTVAATAAGPIAAPAANPRNDIVYIDALTGAVGIETGAEAAVPVDPAIPAGKVPVKRIKAYVGMAEIVAADLEELRYLGTVGAGSAVLTKFFESAEQTITVGGTLTVAHGLGEKPRFVSGHLICKTAEYGYAIGETIEVSLNTPIFNTVNTNTNNCSLRDDATNLLVKFGAGSTFRIVDVTNGVGRDITVANWKFILKAWA
jgi:hypothetical protein